MLLHLRQWFSNWVTIASQGIIIIIFWCGHIFSCHELKGGCYWHLGVSDAVDHSVMHRMASTMKNSYAQSVNRAEIEKPCSRPSVDRTRKYTPKTYIQISIFILSIYILKIMSLYDTNFHTVRLILILSFYSCDSFFLTAINLDPITINILSQYQNLQSETLVCQCFTIYFHMTLFLKVADKCQSLLYSPYKKGLRIKFTYESFKRINQILYYIYFQCFNEYSNMHWYLSKVAFVCRILSMYWFKKL